MKWTGTAACNRVLPKAGVTNFYDTFVLYSTFTAIDKSSNRTDDKMVITVKK